MWLGILLHAIIVYKYTPEANWPSDAQLKSPFLDWLYELIHLFRMPLFFMVAGFFARLVLMKSGEKYFITQRVRRILIPFLVGIVVLVPTSLLPFHFYRLRFVEGMEFTSAARDSIKSMFGWNGMLHLWFLYYLLIFYTFFIIGTKMVKWSGWEIAGHVSRLINHITPMKLGVSIILLYGIFLIFNAYLPPVYTGIRPNFFYLCYYGFFFLAGWVMQINMKSIESFKGYAWIYLLFGILISIFNYYYTGELSLKIELFIMSIGTISLVVGITGIFLRYCEADNKVWRYFSDSAYWVYLIHVCIVAGLQVFLLPYGFSGWVKLLIVLTSTFLISLLTYHLFVRYTIIGEYLHGKRNRS